MKEILIDGFELRSRFLREAIGLGVRKDWVYRDREVGSDEEQYTGLIYRLTDKGKDYFGVRD